ncbi:septum site-determining protein MinC [Schinkia azotoformans]|uniref:septum site-determining protein MinC n=1 Tax=Schinkia azotoformans TaxID=1454 RepID=UPI002DB88DE2|nr:septum site-determining protein MinC [Schinkia azotoformans]MEC1720331.1 septum site-determining protein MinC [Schinkia azotoformans]MED4413334.1 septum site-determining protein MinC [Schinkia azotoformans]
MIGQKQQNVTIKGTKSGLTLYLDDSCSFEQLLKELDEKLSSNHQPPEGSPLTSVHIKAGNRYLTRSMHDQIREIIRNKKKLVIDSLESNVMSKAEALEWKKQTDVETVSKIIRSGQVLQVKGDLLLIGDVNPGGTVMAGGNIFIMGALRGIAHAGCFGNRNAVIAASLMKPMQLRISDLVNRAPDDHEEEGREMECAYIDQNVNQIVIDRVQVLPHLRPNLTRLERGMM